MTGRRGSGTLPAASRIGPALTHPALFLPSPLALTVGLSRPGAATAVWLVGRLDKPGVGRFMRHSSLVWSVALSPRWQDHRLGELGQYRSICGMSRRDAQIGPRLEHTADAFGVGIQSRWQDCPSTGRTGPSGSGTSRPAGLFDNSLCITKRCFAVAFSPDGQSIVTGSDTGAPSLGCRDRASNGCSARTSPCGRIRGVQS